jgi:predicted O-methyltransferase YrrM
LELDLRDRPDHPFVLFNLGMTHLYATKEYEVAAHYLRRSLDRSDPGDSIVRKAYAMLATARACQGEWEAAGAVIAEGLRYYPEDAELLFQAGQVYAELDGFEEARRALERLTAGEESPHYRSVDAGLRTYRGQHELALLHRRMGDVTGCERRLLAVLAEHPQYLPAQLDLVETLHGMGRREEAAQLLASVPAVSGLEAQHERLRRLVCDPRALPPVSGASAPGIPAWLVEAHQRYETANGLPGMAISAELAHFLWSLLQERRPQRILDLGSGFSSYLFRRFAREADPGVTVWSVDDQRRWLNQTRAFLEQENLPTANLCLWEGFHENGFDLILHDLGNLDLRISSLERVISLARPGAAIVLNDAHQRHYAQQAMQILASRGVRYSSLEEATTDRYGRYSWLAVRDTALVVAR